MFFSALDPPLAATARLLLQPMHYALDSTYCTVHVLMYSYSTVISVCDDTQAASAAASTPNASRALESSPNAGTGQSSGTLSLSPIAQPQPQQCSTSLLPGLRAQDVELFEVALTKGPTGLGITIGGYVIDDPVHNGIPILFLFQLRSSCKRGIGIGFGSVCRVHEQL